MQQQKLSRPALDFFRALLCWPQAVLLWSTGVRAALSAQFRIEEFARFSSTPNLIRLFRQPSLQDARLIYGVCDIMQHGPGEGLYVYT